MSVFALKIRRKQQNLLGGAEMLRQSQNMHTQLLKFPQVTFIFKLYKRVYTPGCLARFGFLANKGGSCVFITWPGKSPSITVKVGCASFIFC